MLWSFTFHPVASLSVLLITEVCVCVCVISDSLVTLNNMHFRNHHCEMC